jgi:peptidoglycan hydrolase CwlO-like protein
LAEQNDDLMDKVRRLEAALDQAQHKLTLAEARVAERDAKLHKLLRFGSVP